MRYRVDDRLWDTQHEQKLALTFFPGLGLVGGLLRVCLTVGIPSKIVSCDLPFHFHFLDGLLFVLERKLKRSVSTSKCRACS